MGRKPKPTAQLKISGSWRAKGREDEPSPEVSIPLAPKWLSKIAKDEWRRVSVELAKVGLVAELYVVPLALYCQAYADYLGACNSCKSLTLETTNGNIIQNPAVGAKNQAFDRLLKAAREFGMTPTAIVGTKAAAKEDKLKYDKSRYFNTG